MKTGIHKLIETDRTGLAQHLLALSAADRYKRFMGTLSDVSVQNYANDVSLDTAFGFFVDNKLIASSMLAPCGENRVEFAVSVDVEHRNAGLGREMLNHALGNAWSSGMKTLIVRHARENRGMVALCKNLPAKRFNDAGEVEVHVDLKALRYEQRASAV